MGQRARTDHDGGPERASRHGVATEDRDDPALVVEGVSKQFGNGVIAVDDVSLTVERGSVVGLLGPNGAGKTTLIKCALGIIIPDTGTVRVLGADLAADRRAAYADIDAMLEGARNDYWRLTVRENLRYFATIHGVDPDSVTERHDRLLDRLGLTEKSDTPVRELSRGMKQKVSLASVLAGGAELVFLDEPTLGLDVESSRILQRELRRLARDEGLTIVLSSHDMGVIEAVCDRVVMMANGRIVADDTVTELLSRADRDVIRIASSDIDQPLVTALEKQFDVRSIDSTNGHTTLEVTAAGDRFYDLMDRLREAGVTIDDVRTVQPELADVFVELTDIQTGDAVGGESS